MKGHSLKRSTLQEKYILWLDIMTPPTVYPACCVEGVSEFQ